MDSNPRTTLSSRGQVVLPSATRRAVGWRTGQKLSVETTADGVLLRQASVFEPTRPEDVAGSLAHDGPPVSIADMNDAINHMVRKRDEGGRY